MIDDEQSIRRFLRTALTVNGYVYDEARSGEEGLQRILAARPDVVIVDLGLPDMDGKDIICRLREWSQTPIIVLSVREHEAEKVAALDAGADDYLTKPFAPGELLARIRAALRRTAKTDESPISKIGDLSMDLGRREVRIAGRAVQLTPTEYELLRVLILNAGKVFTHRQLVRAVWGAAHFEDEIHLLRVNISNLRRKLEPDATRPRYIVTEPGVGYRLRTE
ncbi:MAG TPA: response regulator transcription factor [Bryobacteraceae bacterium]|nr:response regulator transcription factor [Bryobacteraceae bacterium]